MVCEWYLNLKFFLRKNKGLIKNIYSGYCLLLGVRQRDGLEENRSKCSSTYKVLVLKLLNGCFLYVSLHVCYIYFCTYKM